MFQFIFDQSFSHSRWRWRWFDILRRGVARYHDPLVRYTLNGRPIVLPLSHQLAFQQRYYPLYSTNLARLAGFVRLHFGALRMIDVGANVGDSYCLAGAQPHDSFLLIEGEPYYFQLLARNTAHDPSVTRVQALLSSEPSSTTGTLVSEDGNASIARQPGAASHNLAGYTTLDEVIDSHPDFRTVNLLKTDVEGYDCKVLMGSRKVLAQAKPVIFFEYHPRRILLVGEDETYIFGELGKLGYSHFIFYDNMGHLVGVLAAGATQMISDLAFYIRQKGHYYDVCCFHDKDPGAMETFLKEERAFYNRLLR